MLEVRKLFPAQIPSLTDALCGPASPIATQALHHTSFIESCHAVDIKGMSVLAVVSGIGNANAENPL